ncbi:hypothetical protein D3C79_1070970 [compost metagenome]
MKSYISSALPSEQAIKVLREEDACAAECAPVCMRGGAGSGVVIVISDGNSRRAANIGQSGTQHTCSFGMWLTNG